MSRSPSSMPRRTAAREVARMVDALGRPVDKGIRRTLVALRLLGYRTSASCQGHLDHGVKAPWIEIGTPAKELRMKEHGSQASGTQSAELKAWEDSNLRAQHRLIQLLDRFYRNRVVSADHRLILVPRPNGAFRLTNQGAAVQDIRSLADAKRKLPLYREEMTEFTSFLLRDVRGVASSTQGKLPQITRPKEAARDPSTPFADSLRSG